MASKTLTVSIVGDASKLKKATGDAGKSVDSLGSKIKGAAIGLGIAALAKGAFDEAQEARKVAAQTAAVIKSTGGAANVSAQQVDELASSISKAAGVDDELVASAENILMTFTSIKNVGVDKVFDRTTQAAVDMAAATGSDAVSAAKMLGKALNDPAAGLSKLTRAGVVFTEQQKRQIKALQESGQVAKAQGVILAEVEKEYGGSAAATATEADKARVAWENFLESAGTAAAPVFNNAAKALGAVAGKFTELPPAIQQTTLVLGAGAAAWAKWGDAIYTAETGVTSIGKAGIAGAAGVGAFAGTLALLNAAVESHTADIDTKNLTASIELFATNGGRAQGELDKYGDSFSGLADDIKKVEKAGKGGVFGGDFLDFGARAAVKDIDKLDKALAGLVSSGNAPAADALFQSIATSLVKQGVPVDTLMRQFDDYGTAAETAGIKAEVAAGKPNTNLQKQLDSLTKLRGAYLSAADAALNVAESRSALPGAQADALNAEGALNVAKGNYARSRSLEDKQALIRAQDAYFQATKRVADLEVQAQDATKDGTKALNIQIQTFKDYAAGLEPGSPVRRNMDNLITVWEALRKKIAESNAETRIARTLLDMTDLAGRSGNAALGATGAAGSVVNPPVASAPGSAGGGGGHGMMPRGAGGKIDIPPSLGGRSGGNKGNSGGRRHSAEWYAQQFAQNSKGPNAGRPGYVQAEDGSWVATSFYDRRPVQAEDGTYVPSSFYGVKRERQGRSGKGDGVTVNGDVVIKTQGEPAVKVLRDLSWHVRAGSGG